MSTNFKSIILAISVFFALSASISAAPGDLDPTFGNGGIADALFGGSPYQLYFASAMAIQPDGKIVVVGEGVGPSHAGGWECAVVQFNPDGSLDTSFGGTGIVINPIGGGFWSVAIQLDGKIVVVTSGAAGTFAVVRYNQNGTLDTSFNGTGIVLTPVGSAGGPSSVAIQTDGKIVVAGTNGNRGVFVRYNPNGSLDTTFNGSGIVLTSFFESSSIAIQADGKIVVVGGTNLGGGDFILVRYNSDGSPDTSLNGTGVVTTRVGDSWSAATDVVLQPDGKLLVAGSGLVAQGGFFFWSFAVVRYNPDGSVDTSFGRTGKILIPMGSASSVALQPNGKIVVGGINNMGDFAVIRLNPNGSTDTSFNGTGTVLAGGLEGGYVAIQADGKVVIAGDYGPDEFKSFVAVRYQGDSSAPTPTPMPTPTPTPAPTSTPTPAPAAPGDLDPTFGNGGELTDWEGAALGVAIQQDGKIVIVGGYSFEQGGVFPNDFRVARYNPDGTPDTTFGGGTGRVTTDFGGDRESSVSVVIQPDGKIVVAGFSHRSGNLGSLALARYNADGSLDITFGGGSGKVLTETSWPGHVADVAVQPDGKILGVIGHVDFDDNYDMDGLMVRYNADGSLDTSFGKGGYVLTEYELASVAVQPADGKIVTHGRWHRLIARFNTDGSPDTGFGSGGTVTILTAGFLYSIAIDSAGKIVVAGESIATFPANGFALFRFNVDGSPDSSFDGDGIVTIPSLRIATSVVIQPDGKIVAAGINRWGSNTDFALARFNVNGSLDNTFGGDDGITTIDFNNSSDFPYEVVLDRQGRAVVVGGSSAGGSGPIFAIARVLGDPTPTATCPNPIDCAEFFVRQHYLDFLSREPEQAGFQEWMNVLNSCNGDLSCLYGPDGKRTLVSLSFFGSQEFNLKGGYVFRFYKATLGRMPTYVEMEEAMRSVTGATADEVFQKRATFAANWVMRNDFLDAFPRIMSPANFVDKIEATAGITLASRNQIINDLTAANNTDTARAVALRAIVDSNEEQNKELNASFVYMQYVGYLRRDPDPNGYNSWLTYLNDHPGDFKTMVWGFVDSIEYRKRFGQP